MSLGYVKLEHGTVVSEAHSDILTAQPLDSKDISPYKVTRAGRFFQFNNEIPLVSDDG